MIEQLAGQFPSPLTAPADAPLCFGGDLRPLRLLVAYSRGIFPWYEAGLPILWWSPDPRCVLPLSRFHLPRRCARVLRRRPFALTLDAVFGKVISACAAPRFRQAGTWLTAEMIAAYEALHALGYAHSVEAWQDGELVGGLYGVTLGRAFFGESMFHRVDNASRAALAGLVALLRLRGALLLDCQQQTQNIMAMGGKMLPRVTFLERLRFALEEIPSGVPGRPCSAECPWEPWKTRYVYSTTCGAWTAV